MLCTIVALASLGGGAQPATGKSSPELGLEVPATSNRLFSQSTRGAGGYQVAPLQQNSPLLVADPYDPRFVVLAHRLDGPDFSCALQVSGDGGRGWVAADPVPRLPPGAQKCYAPEVAFDAEGVLYYLFVGLRGRGNQPMGVFLTSSSDRGRSFTPPRRVLGPRNYQVRMAIDRTLGDRGRIHLVWLHALADPGVGALPPTPNPILASHSDDGGRTFSTPVRVSDPKRLRAVAPALVLGRNHAVHVLYYDLGDDARDYQGLSGPTWEGRWALVMSSSLDGGKVFGSIGGGVVDNEIVPPERVMLIFTMAPAALAADGAGRLYAAWPDARNGDWDVLVSRSGADGRSWSAPRRLNDDRLSNGRHQYMPRLSVAPDGRLDALFYDRRNDPRNRFNDVYYTFSGDDGASFARNLRLTTQASDSRIGQRYVGPAARGLVEFGSRIALLSRDAGALAAWTDTRNTTLRAQQDIFAREAAFPSRGRAGGMSAWVVAALAGGGLLFAGALGWGLWHRRGRGAVAGAGGRTG